MNSRTAAIFSIILSVLSLGLSVGVLVVQAETSRMLNELYPPMTEEWTGPETLAKCTAEGNDYIAWVDTDGNTQWICGEPGYIQGLRDQGYPGKFTDEGE